MFFWRAKKDPSEAAKPADDVAGPKPAVAVYEPPETDLSATTDTNVVTLTPSRLTDRLAQTVTRSSGIIEDAIVVSDASASLSLPDPSPSFPGQDKAFEVLRAALVPYRHRGNILIVGPAGTGRRSALRMVLDETLPGMSRPKDWVYFASGGEDSGLKAFQLPAGEGHAFARGVNSALSKAISVLERLLQSDDYAIGLQVLDEEFKQAHDAAFDLLKRRAEMQNIALVKTPDGYVLAPMHDGRVVKADVFRALPEGLQRDVEGKISGLEHELKALIGEMPSREAAYAGKIAALNKEVAHRAVVPQLAHVRALFAGSHEAGAALDAIEDRSLGLAVQNIGAKGKSLAHGGLDVRLIPVRNSESVDAAVAAVTAWDLSLGGLQGQMGRDGEGRLSIKPGALMRANGGFLIVEAWRLLAEASAWPLLSAALEQGAVVPVSPAGLIVECDALPLDLRLILIADEASWQRLEAMDPGIARFFASVARFQASAPVSAVSEAAYAELASALARGRSLPKIAKSAARALYDNAMSRAGQRGHVSLDIGVLGHILADAAEVAEKAAADEIRVQDIDAALRRRVGAERT